MNFLEHTLLVMREYGIGLDTLRWVQIGDKWMPWEVFEHQANQSIWTASHEVSVRRHVYNATPPSERHTPAYYRRIRDSLYPNPIDDITIVGEGWIMQWSKREEDSECHWRVTRYNHAKPTELALSIFDSNQR